jgi:hypothetical protein
LEIIMRGVAVAAYVIISTFMVLVFSVLLAERAAKVRRQVRYVAYLVDRDGKFVLSLVARTAQRAMDTVIFSRELDTGATKECSAAASAEASKMLATLGWETRGQWDWTWDDCSGEEASVPVIRITS